MARRMRPKKSPGVGDLVGHTFGLQFRIYEQVGRGLTTGQVYKKGRR